MTADDPVPVERFGPSDWKAWIRQRRSGEIDCHGQRVADPEDRRGVKGSTVAFGLASFRQMCRWGACHRTDDGDFLLRHGSHQGARGAEDPEHGPSCVQRLMPAEAVEGAT